MKYTIQYIHILLNDTHTLDLEGPMSRLKDSSSGVWRDRYSKLSKTHFISYGRNKGQKIGM